MKTAESNDASVGNRSSVGDGDDGGRSNLALMGPDQDFIRLKQRVGDLESALDHANRRIERLIGERNQLRTLLDRRDEQIQHLNRDIGGRRVQGGSPDVLQDVKVPSWLSPFRAVSRALLANGRLAAFRFGATQAPTVQSQDSTEPIGTHAFNRPPLVVNYRHAEPKAVLAVVLFGLDASEIASLLPVIERDCSKSDMMPLLLTDNDAFEIMRDHKMVFEYLPPIDDRRRFSRQLNWNLYVQRRLSIIRRKWQPARVIALGAVAVEMLRLWQDSPFEEIPLPTALND